MISLSVCVGTSCHLNGANNVTMTFQHLIEEYSLHDKVALVASFCAQACAKDTVSVKVNDEKFSIQATEARKFFKEKVLPLVK